MMINEDKRGSYCWIKALEPNRTNGLSDTMRFTIVEEIEDYYIIQKGGDFNSAWQIKKDDVVFVDRVSNTIPIQLRRKIYGTTNT